MGQIVWVYGSSAAGKETFIRFVSQKNPSVLLQKLGWQDREIVPVVESIEWVPQYDDDPLGAKREELIDVITKTAKLNPEAIILIKGQDLDLENNRLKKVKTLLPEYTHKIVFLEVTIDEIMQRLKSKSWWDESLTKEEMVEWLDFQVSHLKRLKDDLDVVTLDASKEERYVLTKSAI